VRDVVKDWVVVVIDDITVSDNTEVVDNVTNVDASTEVVVEAEEVYVLVVKTTVWVDVLRIVDAEVLTDETSAVLVIEVT
jgi:hypothetical protein